MDPSDKYRCVLQWGTDTPGVYTKLKMDDVKTVGFEHAVVYSHASDSGLEAYMIERSLAKAIAHFLLRYHGTVPCVRHVCSS